MIDTLCLNCRDEANEGFNGQVHKKFASFAGTHLYLLQVVSVHLKLSMAMQIPTSTVTEIRPQRDLNPVVTNTSQ